MGRIFSDGTAIVAFYTSVNALIILGLGVLTMLMRRKTRTAIGDGGHNDLIRPMRAHGNAVEYAPITLLMMFGLASLGASGGLLHVLGAGLTFSRIAHAAGLLKTTGPSPERAVGMMLGWTVLGVGAIAGLFLTVAG